MDNKKLMVSMMKNNEEDISKHKEYDRMKVKFINNRKLMIWIMI